MCACVRVSVCVSVCPANILVFYFSAIRREIDLKCIQVDSTHYKNKAPICYSENMVVFNSLKISDLQRSNVKVTGTVHCLLKV